MEFVSGHTTKKVVKFDKVKDYAGKVVKVNGFVHKIRRMSGFAFIILRSGEELLQTVYSEDGSDFDLDTVLEGATIVVEGEVVADERAPLGCEVRMHEIEILSNPVDELPLTINHKKLNANLDTNLSYRPIALRNVAERAIFKIQEGIVKGFREYLNQNSFTEIHSPKIVFAGAEGGSNIFTLDYFDKQVFLAQSPQFYKQMMVGVFERVFEVGPVFRAEKHNTSRHLNEYTSLDFEMGFIDSFTDIMEMETAMLKYIMELLDSEYRRELDLLKITLPKIEQIPHLKFMEAKELISKEYNRKITDYDDFEPDEEKLLCDYMKKKHDSGFVFVTHFPSEKRPFYTKDDSADSRYTLGFDLLFNGLEITTGGQRIHDHTEQVNKIQQKGLDPAEFETYLMMHKYGMPPHGGIGMGLERLTMQLLGLQNVRQTSLFPRDINRVTP